MFNFYIIRTDVLELLFKFSPDGEGEAIVLQYGHGELYRSRCAAEAHNMFADYSEHGHAQITERSFKDLITKINKGV